MASLSEILESADRTSVVRDVTAHASFAVVRRAPGFALRPPPMALSPRPIRGGMVARPGRSVALRGHRAGQGDPARTRSSPSSAVCAITGPVSRSPAGLASDPPTTEAAGRSRLCSACWKPTLQPFSSIRRARDSSSGPCRPPSAPAVRGDRRAAAEHRPPWDAGPRTDRRDAPGEVIGAWLALIPAGRRLLVDLGDFPDDVTGHLLAPLWDEDVPVLISPVGRERLV